MVRKKNNLEVNKMISDRRNSVSPYDPQDTWNNYEKASEDFSEKYYSAPENYYINQKNQTSEESILKAFHQSDILRSLKNSSATDFSKSRNMLGLQNKQANEEAINANILPRSIRQENFLDEFFVGSLNVEHQSKQGSFTDRLGNSFEIWENQLPPAERDYGTTADGTSDRRLERLQGYDINVERKKTEVAGDVNPAETPSHVQSSQVRGNELEYNSREAFFNQNGLQPVQEFEQKRDDLYDGYNYKSGHASRVFSLEHSWRDQLSQPVRKQKSSNIPEKSTRSGLNSKRKEISGPFHVKNANSNAISAKAGTITLPYLNQATLRSECMSVVNKSAHTYDMNLSTHLSESDSSVLKVGRLEDQVDNSKIDNVMNGPVPIVSAENIQKHREKLSVTPIPTKEWNIIQQINQGIDHLKEDDRELLEIMENSSLKAELSAPKESFDHVRNNELAAKDPASLYSQTVEASKIDSDVTQTDSKREIVNENEIQDVTVAPVQHVRSDIVMGMSDSKHHENNRFHLEDKGQTLSGEITIGPQDDKQSENTRYSTEHGKQLQAKNIIKNEKKYIDRDDLKDSSHLGRSSKLTKIVLPLNDRAAHAIERPGYSSTMMEGFTINRREMLEETNRNNENNKEQNVELFEGSKIYGEQVSRKEEEDALYVRTQQSTHEVSTKLQQSVHETEREENDIYYQQELKQSHVPHKQLESKLITKDQPEASTFLRTNNMTIHNAQNTQLTQEVVSSLSTGGTIDTDRIHAPNEQNWSKHESTVQQTTKLSEDRSTPCRVPSRSVNSTPVRLSSTVQVESKRELDSACSVSRWTPTLRIDGSTRHNTYSSRDNDNEC
tara:strand:+ start:5679 stop:8195 length:2517 start_codon:yes stop_codon:yes gene_type:complete